MTCATLVIGIPKYPAVAFMPRELRKNVDIIIESLTIYKLLFKI